MNDGKTQHEINAEKIELAINNIQEELKFIQANGTLLDLIMVNKIKNIIIENNIAIKLKNHWTKKYDIE